MCFVLLFIPNGIFAHPGRTDGNGCHTCKTNCLSWGLDTGEYHCHSKNTYSNSKGEAFNSDGSLVNKYSSSNSLNNHSNTTNNNNSSTVIYQKSNNTKLETLTIDGNSISVSDTMSFTTTNMNPSIVGTTSSSKSTLNIDKPEIFSLGNNIITIIVTAEDLTIKKYNLNITIVSNDASLKSLKVGKEKIKISDEMSFVTTDSKISLVPISNNKKAKIIYDKNYILDIGDNEITIKVEAEDGITIKEYKIIIKRELILSNDVGVTIYLNGEKSKFNNYQSETIYIASNINQIDISYELKDENASIDLKYDNNIKFGDNVIKFKIIAENSKEQEYVLNVYRYNKVEEITYSIIAFMFIGGIVFGIYKLVKKLTTRIKNQ